MSDVSICSLSAYADYDSSTTESARLFVKKVMFIRVFRAGFSCDSATFIKI